MAYHEAYWVAIATAAPVIALANTVSITDAANVWLNAKTRRRNSVPSALYVTVISYSVINTVLQLGALIQALLSLLKGKDYWDATLALLSVVSGLVLVFLTVMASVRLRYGILEDQNTPNDRED